MASSRTLPLPTRGSRTWAIGRRVLLQIWRDRRFLVTVIVAPLLIVFFVKVLFDAADVSPLVRTKFAVPFGAFIVHFATFILTAIVLVRERVLETLERMFISGYRQLEIVGGYLIGYTALATAISFNVLLLLQLLFSLDYSLRQLAEVYVVIWLLAVISMALGILVSNVARTEGQVIPFIPLVIVPSFLFAGLVVATDLLPAWAQVISHLSPMFYANNILQEIIAGGSLTADVVSLVALPVYGLVALGLAALTLRERA